MITLTLQVIPAPDAGQFGVNGLIERIRERAGDRPVYVSIDIDVLDPPTPPAPRRPAA